MAEKEEKMGEPALNPETESPEVQLPESDETPVEETPAESETGDIDETDEDSEGKPAVEEPEAATGVPSKEGDIQPSPTEAMEERIKRLENRNAALHRRLSKAMKRGVIKAPDPLDESTAPKLQDFESVEEYEKARAGWETDQKINTEIRKVASQSETDDLQVVRQEFRDEVVEDGRDSYGDWDAVVMQDTVPITVDLMDAVRELESETVTPADFMYYLAKNPTEITAISRMNKTQAIRALTRLETKLETLKAESPPPKSATKPKKTVSDAPAPVKPSSSTVIITKDPNKMTQAEYEAWRAEQMKD